MEIVLFKGAFLELYCMSRTNDSLVAEVMCWSGGRIHWDAKFRCPPQDCGQESFDLFMDMVYSSTEWELGPDKVCWKLVRSRGFEVRGFYLSFYPPTLLSFPWRMTWQSKVPPRVAFFSWFSSLGRVLTTDNLCKRRALVLDWCYICKSCGELVDHLLLYCPIACELWSLVFCLFGIH